MNKKQTGLYILLVRQMVISITGQMSLIRYYWTNMNLFINDNALNISQCISTKSKTLLHTQYNSNTLWSLMLYLQLNKILTSCQLSNVDCWIMF